MVIDPLLGANGWPELLESLFLEEKKAAGEGWTRTKQQIYLAEQSSNVPDKKKQQERGRTLVSPQSTTFTLEACGPLGPWVTSNSTSSPSLRDLKPDPVMAE